MTEAIRLVIWDLDETFWQGTLTEGGISYVQAHHNIVVELARRGIMSAICSKNDAAAVQEVLAKTGLWDYFIFPSINWDTKGPRLAALVEAVQLRPATVLFLDDNAMNRNEAAHFVPGLQIGDEHMVAGLLENPLCRGKDDSDLSRLKQYKLLETRQAEKATSTDNLAFLRKSAIRVTIEHDVQKHYDRVIELINRTNQLNFTKNRLPEDPAKAKAILDGLCRDPFIHLGLVHVQDNYGDYGFVGVYVMKSVHSSKRLLHFCFSCRTLGLSIEKWVYDRLGRPELKVAGEVLTDLSDPDLVVDWVNREGGEDTQAAPKLTGRMLVRGGCEMMSAAHYLALYAETLVEEFNIARDGWYVRLDHSCFLTQSLAGVSGAVLEVAKEIGYQPSDFSSALADPAAPFDVCILSFFMDLRAALYRHPATGLLVPFYEIPAAASLNMLQVESGHSDKILAAARRFRELGFEYIPPSVEAFQKNLAFILARTPPRTKVILTLFPSTYQKRGHKPSINWDFVKANDLMKEFAFGRENIYLLDLEDLVEDESDRLNWIHFGRMVYFRLYKKVLAMLEQWALPEMAD